MSGLGANERAEIERILAAKGSEWASDEGEAMLVWAILAVASVGGIVATFVGFGLEEMRYALEGLPYTLRHAFGGFVVACVVFAICVWRYITLHGRCGSMVTSFGYLRVRGAALRLVRWDDITMALIRKIGGRHRFSVVELTTKQGPVFVSLDGSLFSEIQRRVPPGTQIVRK